MSYTLRGRLESRIVAALAPLLAVVVAAALLREWWPLGLAALMLGVGLVADAAVWHRLLPYQPGWAAVPIAATELAAVVALARLAGIEAPLVPALALFWSAWLLAQVLGHAVFPVVRLTYAEDGGELGRLGSASVAAAPFGSPSRAASRGRRHRPPSISSGASIAARSSSTGPRRSPVRRAPSSAAGS
jgi:hypothetical protein